MNTETNVAEYNPDIFKEEDIYQFEDASTGQRFLNLLIDGVLIRWGLSYLTGTLLAQFLLAVSPQIAYKFFGEDSYGIDVVLGLYLLSILNYTLYYTICEKAFKGYTLGKLITGSRAIREDGKELTFKNALLRSLSRMVPFEPFSALGGTPWHDSWTNTRVVKSR
jgi:uncharacterized RDD family membrane protein YckC